MKCNGYLIKNTGICAGNYKYCATKADYDSWFLSKQMGTFTDYSVIRPDPNSKSGFNVACIHVDLPLNQLTECDYVSFKNDNYDRYFHCQVTDREHVNDKSTRLYVVIDYVATYYDLIKINKSFIERTHVKDDWDDAGQWSNHKYTLNEPIAVNMYHQPINEADAMENYFDEINQHLTYDKSTYCMISAVDPQGNINQPKIRHQSGGAISGFLNVGTQQEIEKLASTYVTQMSKMLNKATVNYDTINSIYFCPNIIANLETEVPYIFPLKVTKFIDLLTRLDFYPQIDGEFNFKCAKTLEYVRFEVVTMGDSMIIDPKDYGSEVTFYITMTGSPQGCATISTRSKSNKFIRQSVSTPHWAAIPIAGNPYTNDYQWNNFIKSFTGAE